MRIYLQSTTTLLIIICLSCRKADDGNLRQPFSDESNKFNPTYNIDDLTTSTLFNDGVSMGQVDFLAEASGLGSSNYNTDMVWSHNDGGNSNELFLINSTDGKLAAKYSVNQASNVDWEDLSVYSKNDSSYTYIADIGDNLRIRSTYSIYFFEEPSFDPNASSNLSINPTKVDFVYPDHRNNAEAVIVDHLTGDIIIATKAGNFSDIYRMTAEQISSANGKVRLEKLGTLPIGNVTAGDMSADGKWLVLKTYDDIYFWRRHAIESISDMFLRTPEKLPYNKTETQGEAFCWTENGYFTLSERVAGVIPQLYFYSKK